MDELKLSLLQELEGVKLESVTVQLVDLNKELLVLRLGFGKLKAAVLDAINPIAGAFLNALQGAVFGAIRWVKYLGQVMAALFGGARATDAMTKSQKKLRSAASRTRRSLMDFDQLQRLNAAGGSGTVTVTVPGDTLTISPQAQAAAQKLREFLEPLARIRLEPLQKALGALSLTLTALGTAITQSLAWGWQNVLVPLGAWTLQSAAPALVTALTAAFSALTAVLSPVLAGFQRLIPALNPVVSFLGSTLRMVLVSLTGSFRDLAQTFTEKSTAITQAFQNVGSVIAAMFQTAAPVLAQLRLRFTQTLAGIGTTVSAQVGAWIQIFTGLTTFLSGAFTGNWKQAFQGLKTIAKGALNSLIGLMNGMLAGLVGGINAAIRSLNKLSITLPSWMPVVGGKHFGFQLPTLSTPKIPALAQGAVLPANAPFLAVLGDQKHGTNIEAPLQTIQEAVASVLLPGQNQSNQLLSQLIAAVRAIRVGDETIGRANERYLLHQRTLTGW